MTRKLTLTSVAFAFSALALAPVAQGAVWSAGHGDLGIGYEGGELEPHWHLGEDGETVVIDNVAQSNDPEGFEFEPNEITARTDLSEARMAGAAWDFVGVSSGESFYLFPQTEDPTVPFLGIGTEELSAGDWVGNLTLTLTAVSGPGAFSLYTVDPLDNPTALMASSDGLTAGDSISLAPETHQHFNWSFTALGDYDLTFQVDGVHTTNGAETATGTFSFSVVPEPSSASLLLGLAGLIFAFSRRK